MNKKRMLIAASLLTSLFTAWFLFAPTHQEKKHTPLKPDQKALPPALAKSELTRSTNFQATKTALSSANLFHMKPLIETFWQDCQNLNNCASALQSLEYQLDIQRFQLLKNYPQQQAHYQQALANHISHHDQSIEQKISQIQQLQTESFADNAVYIFAQEQAFYEQRLLVHKKIQSLAFLPLTEKIAGLDDVFSQSKENLNTLQRYQMALSLIDAQSPIEQQQLQREILATHYLSEDEAQRQITRLRNIQLQQNTTAEYQLGLKKLQQRLQQLRQTSQAHVSESTWQAEKNEQLKQYRLHFFKHE